MNFTTFIVLLIIGILLILDVKYIKVHGLEDCTGSCGDCHGGCGSSCKFTQDMEKARKSIAFKKKIKKFLHLS